MRTWFSRRVPVSAIRAPVVILRRLEAVHILIWFITIICDIDTVRNTRIVNMTESKYTVIRQLGQGGYGSVKVVQNNETKQQYAAKFLNISSQFGYSSYNEI